MWGFFTALISGALMSIQGVFNTEVTKQTSLWVSTGWVQLSAFMVCVLAWIFTGRQSVSALWQVDNKYTLLGGVIGAFITITVIQSMGALGPAKAAMLIVISSSFPEILTVVPIGNSLFDFKNTLKFFMGICSDPTIRQTCLR